MSEWFKELVLKTSDSERGRGFESHPLRHNDKERDSKPKGLERSEKVRWTFEQRDVQADR